MNKLASIETNWAPGDWLFHAFIDDIEVRIATEKVGNQWRLSQGGSVRFFTVLDPHIAKLMHHMPVKEEQDLSKMLLSPMPGLLMKVLVEEGESVSAGQDLAVIEAMKMENTLTASVNGTVSKIVADVGASLAGDDVIIEFES
jgi:propionyl-CoA carboxylase alpha chain